MMMTWGFNIWLGGLLAYNTKKPKKQKQAEERNHFLVENYYITDAAPALPWRVRT